MSHTTAVKPSEAPAAVQTAGEMQLIEKYNQQAEAIRSVDLKVKMKLTGGSNYSDVIEQYHEINGFILALKPASIRVIGQAPVAGKNIFDMVSDGQEFHVFIPSKNHFVVGPTNLQRVAKKPAENLRPQHLLDALLWTPIKDDSNVLFEQANEPQSRFYVLTVLRRATADDGAVGAAKEAYGELEIAQKIWFNRADLNVSRIETYAPHGILISDDAYGGWAPSGELTYPGLINVGRPADDYQLQITMTKTTLNESLAADRFILAQPPGTKLIHAGEETEEPQS